MSRVIVDGADSWPPYIAVLGNTYHQTYLPSPAWRALQATSDGGTYDVLATGVPARVWRFSSQECAVRALRRAKGAIKDANVVSHADLCAIYDVSGPLITIGPTKIAVIDMPEDIKRIKWAIQLDLIDDAVVIEWGSRLAIHWSDTENPPIPHATLERLSKRPDKVIATVTKRGWLLDVSLKDSHSGIVAAVLLERYPVLSQATIAELPELRVLAESCAISLDADFDLDDPWAGGDSLAATADLSGWSSPTQSGRLLFQYQRDGIEFIASRYGRALLADDMGVGKTAQAIGYSQLIRANRITVVCPAALRTVWKNEIIAWDAGTPDNIQVMRNGNEAAQIDASKKWVITSYDLICNRTEVWHEPSGQDFRSLNEYLSTLATDHESWLTADEERREIRISTYDPLLLTAPVPLHRKNEWTRLLAALRNPRLKMLVDWQPNLAILDEIHAVKTPTARRTHAAMILSGSAERALGLTGTPVQNRTAEAATIVRVIHPCGYQILREHDISIARCREMLEPITLRRQKDDVLSDLPPLLEQLIHLDGPQVTPSVHGWAEPQHTVPKWATSLSDALQDFARYVPRNLAKFESLRANLGAAKAQSDDVLQILQEAINQAGHIVVFVAHHRAADTLASRLGAAGIKNIAIADGRSTTMKRAETVAAFQAREIACLIASIRAMGEGITLTAASTVVFLELGWNPAEHAQARDRLRRVGQTRPVRAIYIVAPHAVDQCLTALTLFKANTISAVHHEATAVLGSVIVSSE